MVVYGDGEDGAEVAVAAAVVGGREDSVDDGDVFPFGPHVLLVALFLYLMRPDDGNQFGLLQEVAGVLVAEEDGTVALVVGDVWLRVVDAAVLLLDGVRPQQIA